MSEPSVRAVRFDDDGTVPNSELPLLLYGGALAPAGDLASAFEELFAGNGWGGRMWRNGIFTFRHYHSTAHEVLGIAAGTATVELGGARGEVLEVGPGDAVLIPAGVCHFNLGASAELLVVGAYPDDCAEVDLLRATQADRARALQRLDAVSQPATDPVLGDAGGLTQHWS